MAVTFLLIAVQAALLAIFAFGDIGFDHPGKFGLDFDHFMILMGLYLVALLAGILRSVVRKNWIVAFAQVLIPLSIVILMNRPDPYLRATDYQGLVGKTKAEVVEMIGNGNSGFETTESNEEREFEMYKGLTVYYSPDGRVVKIVARPQ